ncbi:MAG: hypothetical protein KBT88_04290 [Gammaproteobacteria bacterium]|nr:hypothetical protein [Gammaproteobacteria bacterium]MBQ0838983.1 hypothetical protein [Gammaproteobacteria bacterium]
MSQYHAHTPILIEADVHNANPIFAICGTPGSGKSTLAIHLAEALKPASDSSSGSRSTVHIDIDHYQSFTEQAIDDIQLWLAAGGDYNLFQIPQLDDDLVALKEGISTRLPGSEEPVTANGPILFESHFGREHHASGQHIDFMIWLETPLDLALARNVRAFCEDFLSAEESHHHGQIQWLEGYLQNYQQSVRATLAQQSRRLSAAADLILDGQQSIESLTQQALGAITQYIAKGHQRQGDS